MSNEYPHTVVIQFKLSDSTFGSSDELEWRHQLERNFGGILELFKFGNCDGGQSGAGSMELFFNVNDIERSTGLLIDILTDLEWIRFCKVASLKDEATDWLVHYPEGAKFSMWEF